MLVLPFIGTVPTVKAARTWVVDSSGKGDYTNVQDAINVAYPGDAIKIAPGNYSGFDITKGLSIQGMNQAKVVVTSQDGVRLHSDGIKLSNFSLSRNAPLWGEGTNITLDRILAVGCHACLNVQTSIRVTLSNSLVEGVVSTESCGGYGPGACDQFTVANTTFRDNKFLKGIGIGGNKISFTNNLVSSVFSLGYSPCATNAQIIGNKFNATIHLSGCNNIDLNDVVIANNQIGGNISMLPFGYPFANRITIENNSIGGSISLDLRNVSQNNTILNNTVSGSVVIRTSNSVIALNRASRLARMLGPLGNYVPSRDWVLLNQFPSLNVSSSNTYIVGNNMNGTLESNGNSNTIVQNNALSGVDNGNNNTWYYQNTGNHWVSWTSSNPYPLKGSARSVDRYPSSTLFDLTLSQIPSIFLPPSMRTSLVSTTTVASTTIKTSLQTTTQPATLWSITGADRSTPIPTINIHFSSAAMQSIKQLSNYWPSNAYDLLSSITDAFNDPNNWASNPVYRIANQIYNAAVQGMIGVAPDAVKNIYLSIGAWSLYGDASLGLNVRSDGSMDFSWHPQLTVIVMSHTDLLVTDSQGRRVGSLWQNGTFVSDINEIPGARYSGHGNSPTITILPPDTVVSKMEVQGTASETYHLVFSGSGKQGNFVQQYQGAVEPYQSQAFAPAQQSTGLQTLPSPTVSVAKPPASNFLQTWAIAAAVIVVIAGIGFALLKRHSKH